MKTIEPTKSKIDVKACGILFAIKFLTWVEVALVIALYIGSAAVSAIAAIVLGIFGESVVKNLRTRVWDKMIHLPVKYFDEVKTGEMSSRLANDTTQVKNLIANSIPQAFTSIL